MSGKLGTRYSKEIKDAIIERMMPPRNESINKISKEMGISEPTLYTWRKEARIEGTATPGNGQVSEQWNSEDKFLIIMETCSMNEAELAEYGRKKGLYTEQIKAWRGSCLQANGRETNQTKQLNQELKEEKKKGRSLEKELRTKEKALAEAAALLLLRKKAQAIWGDKEDE
jgi:transposase-like protein